MESYEVTLPCSIVLRIECVVALVLLKIKLAMITASIKTPIIGMQRNFGYPLRKQVE